jgi:adenosine deaminase
MTLHAELHRHLGGSVVPRILWRYFDRHNAEMVDRFQHYSAFEDFYTRPRNTLDEYLELHTLVESVQTVETLPYFIYRLMRGAYVFENLAYLELRYTPYLRTPEHLDQLWVRQVKLAIVRLLPAKFCVCTRVYLMK